MAWLQYLETQAADIVDVTNVPINDYTMKLRVWVGVQPIPTLANFLYPYYVNPSVPYMDFRKHDEDFVNDQSELGHGGLKSPTYSKSSRTVSSSDECYPAKATKPVANASASFVARRSKGQAAMEAKQ